MIKKEIHKIYWLKCSEKNKPYNKTFWHECVGIEKFINKIEIENEIMAIMVNDNNVGFLTEKK